MSPRLKLFSLMMVIMFLSLLFPRQIVAIAVDSIASVKDELLGLKNRMIGSEKTEFLSQRPKETEFLGLLDQCSNAKQPQKCRLQNQAYQNFPSSFSLYLDSMTQKRLSNSIQWQEFSPPDGGFRILMPGKPIEQRKAGNSETGMNDLHLFLVFIEEKAIAYGVGYKDFPDTNNQLNPIQINQYLNDFRNEIVKNDRLQSERKITLNGYQGREIAVESSQGFVSKIRIYWVGKRLYKIIVGSPTKATFPKEADTFLDSFKILAIKVMESQYVPAFPNNGSTAIEKVSERLRIHSHPFVS